MFGIGVPELIVIFVIALLIFGPKKLPELGKSLGRGIAEFRRSFQEIKDSIEIEARREELKKYLEPEVGVEKKTEEEKEVEKEKKEAHAG